MRWHAGDSEVSADIADGQWRTVAAADPDAVTGALLRSTEAQVLLDGQPVKDLRAHTHAGPRLAVVTGRIGSLPTLRVADVVLLGLRSPRPPLWQALLGTKAARAMSADDEAHARAVAGRVGLAAWMDRTAAGIPPDVEALTDLTRGVLSNPRAMIWRSPEWLPDDQIAGLRDVLLAEHGLAGFTVAELVSAPATTLPPS